MSKSTAQLRKELAAAIADHDAFLALPSGKGDLILTLEKLEAIKAASRALLAKLDGQPSRLGKPYRVTYQHTQGAHKGRIYNDSHYTIGEAVAMMRTVIGAGARVAMSIRDDNGEYHEKSAEYFLSTEYPDIADSGQYGDAHYSQEATL
jgi:hypothetical protein